MSELLEPPPSPKAAPPKVESGAVLPIPAGALMPGKPLNQEGQNMRRAVLSSLTSFCEMFGPKYRADAVHEYLCAVLELVEQRKITRICVSCPPRTGKSLTTTVMLPAFALARNPKLEIIQGGYDPDLSTEFSVKTKALVNGPRFKTLIGDLIGPNQNRQDSWKTEAGGAYFATNIGGDAVGRGADMLLIDDAFKDRAHARNAKRRKAAYDWFISSALTRLSPDGVVLVIGTRWHRDDLIGRLTSKEYSDKMDEAGTPEEKFFEINIQALCEDPDTDVLHRQLGESHWPSRWTPRKIAAIKARIGGAEFSAQYQGKPRAEGESECDVAMINWIDRARVPSDVKLERAWDLALGVKEQSDYSVGALGGMDKDGNFYLVHIDRKKRRWMEQKAAIVNYAKKESQNSRISVEGVAAWKVAIAELQQVLVGVCQVKSFNPTTDKLARATGWLSLVDAGKFYVVKGYWNDDFTIELEDFPAGEHDDMVDAVSILWHRFFRKQKLMMA